MLNKVSITEEGKFHVDVFRRLSLYHAILQELCTNGPESMYDLVNNIRSTHSAFRFIQPKDVAKVLTEMCKEGYIEETYE